MTSTPFMELLARRMAALDLNKVELARKVEVTDQAIGLLCRGAFIPRATRFQAFANALDCTFEEVARAAAGGALADTPTEPTAEAP